MTCRKPQACTVLDGKIKHPLLLHRWVNKTQLHNLQSVVQQRNTSFLKACLGIIPVVVKGENGNTCRTYALLDDEADKSLCDERLLNALNVVRTPVTIQISTVSSTGMTNRGQEVDLDVQHVNDKDTVIGIAASHIDSISRGKCRY